MEQHLQVPEVGGGTALLVVSGLVKRYATGHTAVDGISFGVARGETLVLLGPSGCGKTTTLRCVAGLEDLDAGEIWIGGECVADPAQGLCVPARRRQLGMVFQSYAVWPHMTVFANVAYPLRLRRLPKPEVRRKVVETLERLGLAPFIDRPVTTLSGGQMQRVALARSLVYNPRLLLFDEPLSNLDAKLRAELRGELRQLVRECGLSAVYVTHDQVEAMVFGDAIAVMEHGRIVQLDRPQGIYNRPATIDVAAFTGAPDLMRGVVMALRDGIALVQTEGGLTLECAAPPSLALGHQVNLSLRPENVRIGPPTGEAAPNRLPGRVTAMEYLGTMTTYTVACQAHTLKAMELGSVPSFRVGATVECTVHPDAVILFDG